MSLFHLCETIFTFTSRVRSSPCRASKPHVLQFGRQKFSTFFQKICRPQNVHLLGTGTDQNPSWEAKRFSASQEIPHIFCEPKIHCRVHETQPPVPILRQISPVQAPISLLEDPILILSSHLLLGFPVGLLSYTLPPKPWMHLSCFPYVLRALPISLLFISLQ